MVGTSNLGSWNGHWLTHWCVPFMPHLPRVPLFPDQLQAHQRCLEPSQVPPAGGGEHEATVDGPNLVQCDRVGEEHGGHDGWHRVWMNCVVTSLILTVYRHWNGGNNGESLWNIRMITAVFRLVNSTSARSGDFVEPLWAPQGAASEAKGWLVFLGFKAAVIWIWVSKGLPTNEMLLILSRSHWFWGWQFWPIPMERWSGIGTSFLSGGWNSCGMERPQETIKPYPLSFFMSSLWMFLALFAGAIMGSTHDSKWFLKGVCTQS